MTGHELLSVLCQHCGRRPRMSWESPLCEKCWWDVPVRYSSKPHMDGVCPFPCSDDE